MTYTLTPVGESKNFWIYQNPSDAIVGKMYLPKKDFPTAPAALIVTVKTEITK